MDKIDIHFKNYKENKQDMVKIHIWGVIIEWGYFEEKFKIFISVKKIDKKIIETIECHDITQFMESIEKVTQYYSNHSVDLEENIGFIFLDTIHWLLLWHKYIWKDIYPTDWHIDEIYPWYKTFRWPQWWLEGALDRIDKECYRFKDWEREWVKNEIKKSIKDKRDIIIDWPRLYRIWKDKHLTKADIEHYVSLISLSEKNFLDKVNASRTKWEVYIDFSVWPEKLIVKDFSRDEALKALNWKKFWLEKIQEIK